MWRRLAAGQGGVLARGQLLALGWSHDDVGVARRFAGWRPVAAGVYAAHTGPVCELGRQWAALLRCGDGAVLASWSALAAAGVAAGPPGGSGREPSTPLLHLAIGHGRRVRGVTGLCLHRRVRHDEAVQPFAVPARDRLEVAVLDAVAECGSAEEVIDVVLRVLGDRRVRAAGVLEELGRRRAQPWRALLESVLADAAWGVASVLEREFLRRVHRAHRLPPARFNGRERLDGRTVVRDVEYDGLVVELDGAQHRDPRARRHDRARDNALLFSRGVLTLRFGWVEVVTDPCAVAAAIVRALGAAGASARPCGAGCALART